jgi:hypothetical protein
MSAESIIRQGRSLICFGSTTLAAATAAGTTTITVPITEAGILGRLVIGISDVDALGATVDRIELNNDLMTSGDNVPAALFACGGETNAAVYNPALGVAVSVNDSLLVTLTHLVTANPITVAFTAA